MGKIHNNNPYILCVMYVVVTKILWYNIYAARNAAGEDTFLRP